MATNTAPIEANCGFSVNLLSDGYNMFESIEESCPSSESDVFVTLPDTYLGPLEDNGGSVLSHRLLEGSPAINGGDFERPHWLRLLRVLRRARLQPHVLGGVRYRRL